MNSQTYAGRSTDQGTSHGTWPPHVACVTPSVIAKPEQEIARLRLALREAHHRSGNQWQLLLSLLDMETMQSPQSAAPDHNVRLRAMMSAFATLNRTLDADADVLTSRKSVSVRAALESVLTQLQTAAGKDALTFAVMQDVWLSEKGCAALLLSCAELVCNAAKYGKKTTQVTFRVQGQQGFLEVRDDGQGFPAGFRVEQQGGQGLQLVDALCRFDLNGVMRCHSETQGGVVTLTFPVLSAPEVDSEKNADADFCGMDGVICFDAFPGETF